uniref:wiskott-Aldrich syndrome protein homolog n=1 Tax=Odobenus rosmarus divergens TaxID=9708 RepID=UPI00063C85FC|nr:PREDICTED: wiskott-Aldrich syndrome protein homolog [Odobenus rosmarus divergens]
MHPDGSSLSTDKPPRRRRGPLGPVAAAAAAHEAGSSAGGRGAEPRGLAPHGPHPSCGERRPGRLEQQRRRSHEEQGKEPAPSRSGCGGCGGGFSSPPPPPPPLPELGGLGPGGGGNARNGRARTPERWQSQSRRGWEGPRKAREGRPGDSRSVSRLLPHAPPARGDQSHRAPIALTGRAEASKPRCLRSGPPLPRGLPARPGPGKPPSPPGPVPGADRGRERWGGEGRSPRGPSSAASLGRE